MIEIKLSYDEEDVKYIFKEFAKKHFYENDTENAGGQFNNDPYKYIDGIRAGVIKLFVIKEGDKILAYNALGSMRNEFTNEKFLSEFARYVEEGSRNMGLMDLLMDYIEEWGQEEGFKYILVTSRPSHPVDFTHRGYRLSEYRFFKELK